MFWRRIERRLRIFESDYGRTAGWAVERNGRCVAYLDYLSWADMFWDNYRVELVTEDPEDSDLLTHVGHWDTTQLVFRSREFGDIALHAIGGRVPTDGTEFRAMMRGLYLNIGFPWPWEWLLLWCRRRGAFARRSNCPG
jgi:hypothetical protein